MIGRVKSRVRRAATGLIDPVIGRYFSRDALVTRGMATGVDRGTQILLVLKYREMRNQGLPPLSFDDVGFRTYSQNDEDGILLYLFALTGTTNRRSVDICAGDGIECNSANLIINHGWSGLLVDGNPANVCRGSEFYR